MADALLAPDIVEAGDAETLGEGARRRMRRRGERLVRRHQMIEHDDDLRRVAHLQDLAPARRQEIHVGEDAGIDLDDCDVAGNDRGDARGPGENLLGDVHAHDAALPGSMT